MPVLEDLLRVKASPIIAFLLDFLPSLGNLSPSIELLEEFRVVAALLHERVEVLCKGEDFIEHP